MPARRRHRQRKGAVVAPVEDPQQVAARTFAQREKATRERQRSAARERREAEEREARRRELTAAKDRAAERLKEVRRRGAPGPARVEAEAAYRAALDALLRDEQGLPPTAPDAADDGGGEGSGDAGGAVGPPSAEGPEDAGGAGGGSLD